MRKEIYIYGTIATIEFESPIADKVMEEIITMLYKLDDDMSVFKEDSIISNINRMAGICKVTATKEIMDIVEKSLKFSELTDGQLDITSKPVVDIIKKDYLDVNEIEAKLKLINYRNIDINKDEKTIKLKQKGMGIDLGSMVKGYATDAIVNILNKYNVKDALIDLGGNVYVKGKNNNEEWNVGIQDPFGDTLNCVGYIKLNNKSVVTSGNYERTNNIISPKTGILTNNNIASVSIIADTSIDAEGLSTGCYILGLDKGLSLIKSLEYIDAIYITKDRKIYCTNKIENQLVILNEQYTIIKRNDGGQACE